MIRKINFLILVFIFLLTLISCNQLSDNEGIQVDFHFQLQQAQSRTIIPEEAVFPVIDEYRMTFLSGPESKAAQSFTDDNATLSLAAGLWEIQAEGLNSSNVFCRETITFDVSAGMGAVNIILKATRDGSGSLSIDLDWPARLNVDMVSARIYEGDFDTILLYELPADYTLFDFNPLSRQLKLSLNPCFSKIYYAKIQFLNPLGVVIGEMDPEVIYVFDYVETAFNHSLSYNDFTPLPEIPESLSVSAISEGLRLQWQDKSNYEIGYNIYRRNITLGHAWSNIVYDRAPLVSYLGTGFYIDYNVIPGNEYAYKIEAYNQAGVSLQTMPVSINF